MRKAILLSLTMFVFASPVLADQAVDPRANAQLGALRKAKPAGSYSTLFKAQDALKQSMESTQLTGAPKSRVVCGMTVIEANPGIDPKMIAPAPKDDNTRYTIRAVEPTICK